MSNPSSIRDLETAIALLDEVELAVFASRMCGLADSFAEDGRDRVSNLFGALLVLAGETQDDRAALGRAVDDGETGGLLSDE